jgi:hypothetical protein
LVGTIGVGIGVGVAWPGSWEAVLDLSLEGKREQPVMAISIIANKVIDIPRFVINDILTF